MYLKFGCPSDTVIHELYPEASVLQNNEYTIHSYVNGLC